MICHSKFIKVTTTILIVAAFVTFTHILFRSEAERKKPFTIVVLPDTQLYSLRHPRIFAEQTRWINEQKHALNIAFVIHEGDITHRNTEKEWEVADRAMSILDDTVPYCIALGNHDLGPGGRAKNRNADLFNKHFGPQRFKKKSWYGGHFGIGNENAFYLIDAAGMKFLILCLEFGPRNEVLQWADKIVAKHKNRRAIIVTHCYTNSDDTRVGEGDELNPHSFGSKGNDGDEIWENFVKKHKNIFLVLSGHILNDGLGRLTSIGDYGNNVHQILANYQMKKNGGNGWLRIMKFVPAQDKIVVTTYSPVLKKYATDAQNQFELEYSMD